ncbi:MAG: hypothetical protein L0H70_00765, partial [Xanthomonadales bacterium]|nr:hypothetical protein [Xanthomonadales bacterium]
YGTYNAYSLMADFNEANLNLRNGAFAKAYDLGTQSLTAVRNFRGQHHHDVYTFQQLRIVALIGAKRLPEARSLWAEVDAQRQTDWPNDEALRTVYADLSKQLE